MINLGFDIEPVCGDCGETLPHSDMVSAPMKEPHHKFIRIFSCESEKCKGGAAHHTTSRYATALCVLREHYKYCGEHGILWSLPGFDAWLSQRLNSENNK